MGVTAHNAAAQSGARGPRSIGRRGQGRLLYRCIGGVDGCRPSNMCRRRQRGAVVGLLAALGHSPEEMIDMVTRGLSSPLLRRIPGGNYLNIFRLLRCGHLARWLRRYCPSGLRLESLSPRLVIQCADLVRKRNVLIGEGPAAELVIASCTLPGFGKPYAHDGMLLLDSCSVIDDPAALRAILGVDLIVGIQTTWPRRPRRRPKTKWYVPRSIARILRSQRVRCLRTAQQYDLVIAPVVSIEFTDMDPRHADQLLASGREAAREKLPQLAALLRPAAGDGGPGNRYVDPGVAQAIS